MYSMKNIKERLLNNEFSPKLSMLYGCSEEDSAKYAERFCELIDGFKATFGDADEIALFSAPGRTEIGGNHTDHQHGCVLAGSVNLDIIAAARPNGTNTVRIQSKGYEMDVIDLDDLEIHPEQYDKAIALIRGILKKFTDNGYRVKGFDAYTMSDVFKGSGLSSSAAFEVLVATVINGLFCDGEVSPVEIAKYGQYAENVYYNKPSGLLDQMACSVGAVVAIDFKDNENPVIEQVDFDLHKYGYALCIIDSGADHAELTGEYAAVPQEMKQVAAVFGKQYLREVDEEQFMSRLKEVKDTVKNDRAVLRAIHFFKDNKRAQDEVKALRCGDFEGFKKLVIKSGYSSYMYLQNVYASSMPKNQDVALLLALCEELLEGKGAWRVHGGGFAGTVQAFVPINMVNDFKKKIEAVYGEGKCYILSIRPVGGYEL